MLAPAPECLSDEKIRSYRFPQALSLFERCTTLFFHCEFCGARGQNKTSQAAFIRYFKNFLSVKGKYPYVLIFLVLTLRHVFAVPSSQVIKS